MRNVELPFPVRLIDRNGWQSDSLLRYTDVVAAWSDKRLSAADNRDQPAPVAHCLIAESR
jgi:hypothetical protein